jgi:hypothetical protein
MQGSLVRCLRPTVQALNWGEGHEYQYLEKAPSTLRRFPSTTRFLALPERRWGLAFRPNSGCGSEWCECEGYAATALGTGRADPLT